MKKLIFSLISFAITTITFSQNLEIKWQQCFGGSEEDLARDIIAYNGTYFIVGGTSSNDGDVSFNHGTADAWIIKMDSIGNILWEKTYGGSNGEWFIKMIPTNSEMFYLIGSTASSDGDISYDPYPGSRDIWVVKINNIGDIVWEKVIGGEIIDNAESGALTNDGGVVVFGWTGSQNGDVSVNYGYYDMWLAKLNSDGEIEWDVSLGTDDFDYGHSLIQTSDGGFLVGGASTIGNGGNLTCEPFNFNAEAILVKLDSKGKIEWQNCYGGSGHEGIYGLLELEDGYAFTAYAESPDGDVTGWHGEIDIWLVRTDLSGNIIWEQCYGGYDGEIAHHIFENGNGDFTIIGQTRSNDGDVSGNHSSIAVDHDIWIFRINTEGLLINQRCYGGQGNEAMNGSRFGIVKQSDNNFVIVSISDYGPSYDVGCTPHGGNGDEDWWVFEIDSLDTTGAIENEYAKDLVKVYPNPTKDYVIFEIYEKISLKETTINILDIYGQEVAAKQIISRETVFDLRQFKAGIYFYRVENEGQNYSGKFIVQR